MRKAREAVVLLGVVATTFAAFAFPAVPKESARALRATRGRPFSSGAVFINGKYLDPPYVVERWGTGIRINDRPVTGQVLDWGDFVKTQAGVKATRQEPGASTAASSAAAPVAASEDVDAGALDDLFDDSPKQKKSAAAKTVASKPQPTVTYELKGDFVPNEATKKMVAKINAYRTDIDRTLRTGGFICFGDDYSQVTGDARTLMNLLEKLPECQKNASSLQDFSERARTANLVYLNEVLRRDFYRNRIDYLKLQERRENLKLLDKIAAPLF